MTDTSPTRFQSFTSAARPENGPPRLESLRERLVAQGLAGFLVPRADAHQGEYVAPRDERLSWLTGFTGSAGFAAILPDIAGVFIDGRYRVQVKSEVDLSVYTPVPWPETKLEDWLIAQLPQGGAIGFDPWLHSSAEIERLEKALTPAQISLVPTDNQIDAIWPDQPLRPAGQAEAYPVEYAGTRSVDKRENIGALLTEKGQSAAVLTLPDSICWLLNIRGHDLAHLPVVQAFAIIAADGHVTLFSDPEKFVPLGPDPDITIKDWDAFEESLQALSGPVRIDPATAPHQVRLTLEAAGIEIVKSVDPCIFPKARKTSAEVKATAQAHLRDGAAMAKFLHWFDEQAPKGGLTEIDCVRALEGFRAETGALLDISFDTIAGAGSNGAIVHYRVTEGTNAPLKEGELFLIDSGAQYQDGTTDITRTLPVGQVGLEEKTAFTQVLRGMIGVHMARFPKGISGRDIDALARAPLWAAGRDFDHGTGHGVGVYLSVHEGPQRISRASSVPLEVGMILSNEPGYYREGAFGIRIENLIVVREAPALAGGDDRAMLCFDTLSYAPIDRRLILPELLTAAERDWLNAYHRDVADKIGPQLEAAVKDWLIAATASV